MGRWVSGGGLCRVGRGSRQARDGWRAPASGQDVLPRGKRLPAARTRRPTGARAVDLVMTVLNTSARGAATRGRPMTVSDNIAPMIRRAFRLYVDLVPLALAACATQATPPPTPAPPPDRKSVVEGKRVHERGSSGGSRLIKNKKQQLQT